MNRIDKDTCLLVGELLATLETLIAYCADKFVQQQAQERLNQLQEKYKDGVNIH